MNEIDLSRADLNLLVLFETVLTERHVGRAAERLNLTPSAVSHGLGRLRRTMNDPLFLRTPRGVVPTARAMALAEPVEFWRGRGGCWRAPPRSSRPRRPGASWSGRRTACRRCFCRASSARWRGRRRDRHRLAAGAALAGAKPGTGVARSAGGARSARDGRRSHPRRARRGAVSCAAALRGGLRDRRAGGAAVRGEADAGAVLCASARGRLPDGDPTGFVDAALAERGVARRVALTVPNFAMALAVVADGDFAAALPRRFLAMHGRRFGVVAVEAPLPLPFFRLNALVPKAALMDDGVAWLLDWLCESPGPPG